MSARPLAASSALAVDTLSSSAGGGRGLAFNDLDASQHDDRQAKLSKWSSSSAMELRGIEEAGHDNFKVVLRIRKPVQVIEGFGDLMGMMRKMKANANAAESDSEAGSVAQAILAQQGQPDSPEAEEAADLHKVEDSAGNLYHFDRVFRQNATQQHLWDEMLRDVTDTVLDGQDTLVFGSGACG